MSALSQEVQNLINSFSSQYSVDPAVMSAIATVNSNGVQRLPDGTLFVNAIGIGVMGVSSIIGNTFNLNVIDLQQNIQTGAQYLSQQLKNFVGNYPLAVAAYYLGSASVYKFNGIPPFAPVQNFVYNVSTLAHIGGSTKMNLGWTLQNQTVADPSFGAAYTAALANSSATQQATGQQITGLTNSIQTSLQVSDSTLSNVPWYQDSNLLTGNPTIRRRIQPVSFVIYLDQTMGQQLVVSDANGDPTGKPVELQLNTSLTTFNISSKHVYNRTPSRTGMHVTFWGMQPDLISGTGTTGVFMNQYGLTDFFSTVNIPEAVKQQIKKAFAFIGPPPNPNPAASAKNAALINNPESIRVAAQDAFIEFMKLFQMNANRWFNTPNYSGSTTGQDQMTPTAFSPQTGITSFQQHARNNDVMTRGYVAMKWRSNIYLGYFKTLNWTMSADSPFKWDFNFTFQVERTYSALYTVNSAAQQPNPPGSIANTSGTLTTTLPNGITVQQPAPQGNNSQISGNITPRE